MLRTIYRPIPVYGLCGYREALGLSQVQCAQACGLSVSHYQRLEQGKAWASPLSLRKLAKGLHVPVALLKKAR